MKVILTTKKEKTNLKQITDLLHLILFDYNIEITDKKERKVVTKSKKTIIKKQVETNKTVIEKRKNPERKKREKEWLEDYYYSQSKDKEEIDKLVNYYSNSKRIANNY